MGFLVALGPRPMAHMPSAHWRVWLLWDHRRRFLLGMPSFYTSYASETNDWADTWIYPCWYHGSQHANPRQKVGCLAELISLSTDATVIGLVAAGHCWNPLWSASRGTPNLLPLVFLAARASPATSLLAARGTRAGFVISRESMYLYYDPRVHVVNEL